MTKAEVVNEISLKTGTDRKEVLQIVEGFMESVKASLASRENV
jgi:DNA-binding protein HU-beta